MTSPKADLKKLDAKKCAAALLKIKDPVIMIHVRPDGDAVGSGAALAEIYSQLGIEARLLAPDKIPARLSFILENCGVKLASSAEGKTAVSIDVASPGQLGNLYSEDALPKLMIDHHAVGEQFADGYIAPEASSAAEALFDIVKVLIKKKKIKMTGKLAYALYAAMSSDTGCFMYSNTTPKTHMYAAILIELGINAADINHRLFTVKTAEQIKAEGYIGANIKTADGGSIAYASVTARTLSELGIPSESFDTAIDIVRSLRGCETAIIAKEIENGKFKISMRATEGDVATVAQKFGGGGHKKAAGCTIAAKDADEAIEILIKELIKFKGVI